MKTEEFLHDLSNKMCLIDLGLNRLKKTLSDEQVEKFGKVEKSLNEALDLLRDFKNNSDTKE